MTRHRGQISVWQQVRWFYRTYRPGLAGDGFQIFLWRDAGRQPVAYGALSLDEGEYWITECVARSWRGRGVGGHVLAHLQDIGRAHGRVLVAEIRADNEASLRLHRRLGFSADEDEAADLRLLRWSPN